MRSDRLQEASHGATSETEFDEQVVSAIGEAFNNVAIHGYGSARSGEVHVQIQRVDRGIEVCMSDYGVSFDLSLASPKQPSNEPEQLPESGMGLFIIRSFMDSVSYRPGNPPTVPNVLRLVKWFAAQADANAPQALPPEAPEPDATSCAEADEG